MTQASDSASPSSKTATPNNRPMVSTAGRQRSSGAFAELYKKMESLKKAEMQRKMLVTQRTAYATGDSAEKEESGGPAALGRRRNGNDAQDEGNDEEGAQRSGTVDSLDTLDPLQRALWQDGPPRLEPLRNAVTTVSPAHASPRSVAGPELELAVERFLKRFAMSGDRRRGTAHLEIGSGELAGGSLTVNADGEHVELFVNAPPGADVKPYIDALTKRLDERGISHTLHVT